MNGIGLGARVRLPELSGDGLALRSDVAKILRGAKPSELPIEQPVRFELAVNGETAKALGIALPATLLVRANEVVE